MNESNLKTCVIDGVIFSEDGKTLIKMPTDAQKSTYIVPDDVESIAPKAFEDCDEITTVIVPLNLKYLGYEAFKNCKKLYSFSLHSSFYDIGGSLFVGCDNLSILTISCDIYGFEDEWSNILEGINTNCRIYLDDYYYSCGYDRTDLLCFPILPLGELKESMIFDKTYIPDGTLSIEEAEYSKRGDIGHLTFPNTLVEIKKRAFENCKELHDVVLPSSLQTIDDHAFANCQKLSDITFSEGLRHIGAEAFLNTSITTIHLPSTISTIDETAFDGCLQLADIHMDPQNTIYSSIDGVLYNKDQTKLILVPCQKEISKFVIPDSVVTVSERAFVNCKNITQLHINDALQDFPVSAIDTSLLNLESIYVSPDSKLFKLIDGVLFSRDGKILIRMPKASQVANYVIPSSVEKIQARAFYGCNSLSSITIPKDVISIGKEAFHGCQNLTTLNVRCDFTKIGLFAFSDINHHSCAAYVPEDAFNDGFDNTCLRYFKVYSLDDHKDEVVNNTGVSEVNVCDKDFAKRLKVRSKIIGDISLKTINAMHLRSYEYLDVSEATFGYEWETWSNSLGISHHGPVYGKGGSRKVDLLTQFLSDIKVSTVVLPDDVQRRHINAAKKNKHIKQLIVRDSCILFSYVDGKLMNKKKTQVVFGC